VAEKLNLSRQHSLIDLGTGPGLLASALPPMSAHRRRRSGTGDARRRAAGGGARVIALTLIESKAEDLPAGTGHFDIVTIGRALHWMDRDAMPAL